MSGQASAHLPQPVHFSRSTVARKFFTVTAPVSQTFMHLPQPMHAVEQAFFAAAPSKIVMYVKNYCMTVLSLGTSAALVPSLKEHPDWLAKRKRHIRILSDIGAESNL